MRITIEPTQTQKTTQSAEITFPWETVELPEDHISFDELLECLLIPALSASIAVHYVLPSGQTARPFRKLVCPPPEIGVLLKATFDLVQKCLDDSPCQAHHFTMVKSDATTDKGEQTRALIFRSALQLFREYGFDETTMQAIANHAGVVKSAAYYYFPSKESFIQAYYEDVQAEQERLCVELFAASDDLKARLRFALLTKLDLAKNDRALLGVVFRYTGEPQHPLSCLGPGTAEIRRRSVQVFVDAIAGEELPRDLRVLLPTALWSLQMGMLIMFLYDNSPGQQRTRRLAEGAISLTVKLLGLAKLPILKPVRSMILKLLQDAELLPDGAL